MPRYRYECSGCGEVVVVFHGIKEVVTDCKICEEPETMKKILSTPLSVKKKVSTNKKVGDITKDYIEKNRQILNQQKKEAKEKTYEPS
jgi:putative FmdB family regulatory protein